MVQPPRCPNSNLRAIDGIGFLAATPFLITPTRSPCQPVSFRRKRIHNPISKDAAEQLVIWAAVRRRSPLNAYSIPNIVNKFFRSISTNLSSSADSLSKEIYSRFAVYFSYASMRSTLRRISNQHLCQVRDQGCHVPILACIFQSPHLSIES